MPLLRVARLFRSLYYINRTKMLVFALLVRYSRHVGNIILREREKVMSDRDPARDGARCEMTPATTAHHQDDEDDDPIVDPFLQCESITRLFTSYEALPRA